MSFNEWLVENGYARSVDTIESDISASEADVLYEQYQEENR